MRVVLSVSVIAGMVLSSVSFLNAQVIQGLVVNALNGEPLADVSVVLLDKNGAIQRGYLTDVDGLYTLACPKSGTYTLRIGGMGFPTWDSPPMKVGKEQTVDFTVRLVPEGEESGLAGFKQRMKEGNGVFLSEKEIRKKGGTRFTDVLLNVKSVKVIQFDPDSVDVPAFGAGRRMFPTASTRDEDAPDFKTSTQYNTLRITGSHSGSESAGARTGGEPTAQCPPVLFVDGKWWGKIDNVGRNGPDYEILPSELVGLEIYTRQLVPPRFDTGLDSQCGVIVAWRKQSKK